MERAKLITIGILLLLQAILAGASVFSKSWISYSSDGAHLHVGLQTSKACSGGDCTTITTKDRDARIVGNISFFGGILAMLLASTAALFAFLQLSSSGNKTALEATLFLSVWSQAAFFACAAYYIVFVLKAMPGGTSERFSYIGYAVYISIGSSIFSGASLSVFRQLQTLQMTEDEKEQALEIKVKAMNRLKGLLFAIFGLFLFGLAYGGCDIEEDPWIAVVALYVISVSVIAAGVRAFVMGNRLDE